MKFAKEGRAKYISHLDLMHTLQRAMARCNMPLWFTEGFNQHAYVSVALPLSTGFSSECEYLDFQLLSEGIPSNAVENLNHVFPEGLRAISIYPFSEGGKKVAEIAYSKYCIILQVADGTSSIFSDDIKKLFTQDSLPILKRSKRGEKEVNIKDFIMDLEITFAENTVKINAITAAGNTNLSPEYITKAIQLYLPQYTVAYATYHRLAVYTKNMQEFR